MTVNVAIIGAGQLGSRHLQGLAACKMPLSIYLVDPSLAALDVAQDRYNAINTSATHDLSTSTEIADLPDDLELVIVACTAGHRFSVYKSLQDQKRIQTILLEKVLFQDLAEYPLALELDRHSTTTTVVNLAKRYWPFFQDLRDRAATTNHMHITITGSQWGLGCNSIHHIDIAEFVWGSTGQTTTHFDPELIPSKRQDFYEFTGTMQTNHGNGNMLVQTSYPTGNAPLAITAQCADFIQVWDVTNSRLTKASADENWVMQTSVLQAPFQSNLTTQIIEDQLAGLPSILPTLVESSATHVATLNEILNEARTHGHDFGTVCPVT